MFALLCSISMRAQFSGGFGCGDPDAWFDKEIYFYCQNNVTNYYGYGQNLSNVSFVVYDGKDYSHFDYYGIWTYQGLIFIDKEQFKFKKGCIVYLFLGDDCYGSWTCNTNNPTTWDNIKRLYDMKPKGRSNIKIKVDWKRLAKLLRKLPR